MDTKSLKGYTILIVEDSKTQLKLVSDYLQSQGAEVMEAVDGKDGFEQARNNTPDIVITDIEMPVMNGYELCRKIKDIPDLKHLPVILLTNLSDSMDVIKGIECGADNFLTKPCSEERLINSLQDSLANAKIEREMKPSPAEIEFSYRGFHHKLRVNQNQIIDLLLSTYSNAMEKNSELEKTNRKLGALHLELQQKNEELTKTVNDKNLLLGMAAHDLRNPLNAIKNYSELLEMKLPENASDSILRMVRTIGKSSKFMLSLVNDLLDISVVEFGKLKMNIQENDLLELIQNNCKLNETLAEQKEITLSFACEDPIPPMYFDANKIEQVLNNLISNAIKYSHPGSTVEIALKKEPSRVVLQVRDEGIGIPENETHNLFDIYKSSSKQGTSGEPSTGLGLAIVKRIVDEHRGEIWVESALGKGTTFYVALPCTLSPEDFTVKFEQKKEKRNS